MSARSVALFAIAAMASLAQATTYTCVGADGRKSFSDLQCPPGSNEVARKSAAPAKTARHGLSFGLMPLDASFKDVRPAITEAGDRAIGASCHAAPAPIDRPCGGTCDPYQGDTACSRSLPLLCFRPGERSARSPTRVDPKSGRSRHRRRTPTTWPNSAVDRSFAATACNLRARPRRCAQNFARARCRGIVDRVERSSNQADAMNEALFEMLQHCVAEMSPPRAEPDQACVARRCCAAASACASAW